MGKWAERQEGFFSRAEDEAPTSNKLCQAYPGAGSTEPIFIWRRPTPVTKTDNAPGDCLRTLDRIVGGTSSKIGPAEVKKNIRVNLLRFDPVATRSPSGQRAEEGRIDGEVPAGGLYIA